MPQPSTEPEKERLQKILARAGFGSRRACEELIVEGRVTINNQTVSLLGVRADAQRDVIAVDGERVHLPRSGYWIMNKLEGVSFNDAEAEESMQSLVKGVQGRLFSAGRLDRFARGLMLITNDGRVANLMTHPRYRVPKVYRLIVKGDAEPKAVRNIERALFYAMNNGKFQPIEIGKRVSGKTNLTLTVYEGLPQALRDICLKFGHPIKHIERERLGPIPLEKMTGGAIRKLNDEEVKALLAYADDAEAGRLTYERELVSPARFDRDEDRTDFRRKKTGARGTTSEGQKKTSARVRSSQGRGRPIREAKVPRGDRPPRREGSSDRPPRREGSSDRPQRRDGPRGDRPPRREGSSDRPQRRDGPRGDRPPRREGSSDRPQRRDGPRGDKPPRRDGPRTGRPPSRGGPKRPRRD